MSIVNIDDYRLHICCNAECLDCGNKWVAVAPAEVSILQCQKCHGYNVNFSSIDE